MTRYRVDHSVTRNEDGDDYIYDLEVVIDAVNVSEIGHEYTVNVINVTDEEDEDFELTDEEKEELIAAIKERLASGEQLPVDPSAPTDPDYGVSEGDKPDNTLPGGSRPTDPGYGKPEGGRPDQGLPTRPGAHPDQGLPSGGKPDNTLPPGGKPDNELPNAPVKPGQPLPDEQPGIDNTLPGQPTTPDNELPETPEPKPNPRGKNAE